ncbi:MAG: TatD family deoxyribonuclease [Proteobacteria bacterium]|nr:TatD family deoxyribonuclease [Pseudomonadota bacterium]
MKGFIDTHAHLAMLQHSSLTEVMERAQASQIEKMVTVSVDEKSWEANRILAESHSKVWYSLGLHPHEAKDWVKCRPRFLEAYKKSHSNKKCVALGEMGLDFFYNHSERDVQISCFTDQLQLAKQWNLPVIIHSRDAFQDTYDTIRKVGLGPKGGVMHCFTGNAEQAKEAVDLGLLISFSGILTFKTATELKEAAKSLDKSKIVIETDCPFLAPVPFRGKPNEPSLLPEVAKVLAQLKNCSVEEIAENTSDNACRLFCI